MKLLRLSEEEIEKLVEEMEVEVKNIYENLLRLSWYMRGGVRYLDLFNMNVREIEVINKIIDGNLELTKNSKLPFF